MSHTKYYTYSNTSIQTYIHTPSQKCIVVGYRLPCVTFKAAHVEVAYICTGIHIGLLVKEGKESIPVKHTAPSGNVLTLGFLRLLWGPQKACS